MRRRLVAAIRAFVETLGGAPYFTGDPDEEVMTAEQWLALMVLHAEGVHGCEHTDMVRAQVGMVGPRGEAAEVAGG